MVIVKLMGGLGNQMFQYAFGRHIALKNKRPLKLDLSFYEQEASRQYELGHFAIDVEIASQEEIDALKERHFSLASCLSRRFLAAKPQFVHQKGMAFDPGYSRTQRDVYLDGYWQSENFFRESAEQIKRDFQFKTEASSPNRQLLSEIAGVTAVSLHIRRGDLVENKSLNKIHGLCTLEYYSKAADLISRQTSQPVFFIFSDDMEWAKNHLKLNHEMRFVDINDQQSAHEDFRLMSCCKHNILANSSFSWWAAWLNQNYGQITIAPKKWFADAELDKQSSAIAPDTWIRI